MAYDDVILRMGEFGRYQRKIYLLLCLPAIICAFHKLVGPFLGPNIKTRCLLPGEERNASYYLDPSIMNASYPWDNTIDKISQCERYISQEGGGTVEVSDNPARTPSIKKNMTCQEFVFDTSTYNSTITSEWKLVCDRAWQRPIGDSFFMAGVMVGSILFGALSDKFGRRPIFFLSLIIQLVGGILVAAAPEHISYVIFRMIVGSTTSGVFLVAYVIALEMVGPKKRLVASVGCQLFFTTGYILTGVLSYLIRDWRLLQIAITLPSFVFLVYWWFIPESARWLFTNGKEQEAKDLLQRAARENGIEISDETLHHLLNDNDGSTPDTKKASLLDLFRYPNLRRKSILLFFNWLVNSATYYGLSWNASALEGDDHINFIICGLVEIPAYTFLIFTLDRWGRKKILCGCMILSGAALIMTSFFEKGDWKLNMFAMIGKLAITSSYGAIYIFTAEQYPTVVRNVGLGASSTFARIGGIIAPSINYLNEIWLPLPLVIFGACACSGGIISLMLPETLNKKLPETIQDGELFGLKEDKMQAIKDERLREIQQLTDLESIKPLKAVGNGVHDSKQNG